MNIEIKYRKSIHSIISYFLISSFLSVVISLSVSFMFQLFNFDLESEQNVLLVKSIYQLIVYLFMFIILFLINKDELISDVKKLFKNKINIILISIIASYGIFYVINGVFNVLVQNAEAYINEVRNLFYYPPFKQMATITSTATNQVEIEALLKSSGAIFMFISAGVVGPICEEIVFRKAFFNLFKSKELGILISSLFFGFIHINSSMGNFDLTSSILMTIPYIVSGVAFGYIYIKNDCNVVLTTIVHMLTNIISMLGILFLI